MHMLAAHLRCGLRNSLQSVLNARCVIYGVPVGVVARRCRESHLRARRYPTAAVTVFAQ